MASLPEIFEQQPAVEWIARAFRADRLPHGLIFAGPTGVGKATTARALGALFLCEAPKDADIPKACGKCESCRVSEGGAHPDFHVITRELIRYHDKTGKSKGIDLSINVIVPELVEPAARKAVMGRGKVFVVEQADLMNPHAQNALLKTLEEPAGRSLIILLTDQPGVLLPTIRSRCQLVRFSALPPERVQKELRQRGIDTKTADSAARLAEGSLGLALKWIEDGVVEPANDLIGQVDRLFAGNPPEDLPGWFKKASEDYAQKQLDRDKLSSKDAAAREAMRLYLHIMAEHIRRKMSDMEDEDLLDRACTAIDVIARAEQYLDSNVNTSILFNQLASAFERQVA